METLIAKESDFMVALEKTILRAKMRDCVVALCLFDLTWRADLPPQLLEAANNAIQMRLENTLRKTDTISELKTSEFGVILGELMHLGSASMIAERIVSILEIPFELGEYTITPKMRMVICTYPFGGNTSDILLKTAKANLKKLNKKRSKENFLIAGLVSEEEKYERKIIAELQKALKRQQFILNFQPIYDIANRRMTSWEALVRWQHPEIGHINAEIFLTYAQKAGLMMAVNEWVILHTCRQLQQWRSKGIELKRTYINISAQQMETVTFLPSFLAILTSVDISPHCLGIDINNIGTAKDLDFIAHQIKQLASMQIEVAIDDFGRGYSSLAYFDKLPAKALKITRSYIDEVPDNPRDTALLNALVSLATTKGITVTAKGIETEVQYEHLKKIGCQQGQGYLLCKPLAPVDMMSYLLNAN